jgi:hypothetical protein
LRSTWRTPRDPIDDAALPAHAKRLADLGDGEAARAIAFKQNGGRALGSLDNVMRRINGRKARCDSI